MFFRSKRTTPTHSVETLEKYVVDVWHALLGRRPDENALAHLVRALEEGRNPIEFFFETYESSEAITRRQELSPYLQSDVRVFVPPGHYYSPIVDPVALRSSSFEERRKSDSLDGISIDFDVMEKTFNILMDETSDLDFPRSRNVSFRYYSENDMYASGDAIILAGMIRLAKPRKIIEVGSGFSSAVMLDTLDRSVGIDASLTFIEPYPERLDDLLWDEDRDRIRVIRSGVQEVSPSIFLDLDRDDILFLDTTHVSKTGSDVNFELFDVLPKLKSGVLVHFHDVFEGFEYPDDWVYEQNRSWNEIYLLRSFLMYNREFEIVYFNHAFYCRKMHLIEERCPRMIGWPGGGLWLRRK